MQATSVPVTIPLRRPLHLRAWGGFAGMVHATWGQALQAWRAWSQRVSPPGRSQGEHLRAQRGGCPVHRQRDWAAMAELSPHTLRDIGAPDWLVLNAAEQHASPTHRLRRERDVFSVWRGV